jgi:hypothetical protein
MIERELIENIYYLWHKYQDVIVEVLDTSIQPIRQKYNFYKLITILQVYMKANGQYNGQTKTEFNKNFKRVSDIVSKSEGDEDKAIRLAKTQTKLITDEWKAINRAMAAKDMGQEHIFEVFFQRAYELGSVSRQDYRDYKLEKLGIYKIKI